MQFICDFTFFLNINFYIKNYQRKKGSQHNKNTPTIIPSVRAALCSARHDLPAARSDAPTNNEIFISIVIKCVLYYAMFSYCVNSIEYGIEFIYAK